MSLKKLLAITLVLAMVLSFMPTYAFASGDDATEEPVSEAAAEEPVVEEDPVVEEEPEAPQEEPETWDAPEDVLPEEPVEEAEVGASGFKFVFKADKGDTSGYEVDAKITKVTIAGEEKNAYYVTSEDANTAKTMVTKTGYDFVDWREVNGDEFNQGLGVENAIIPDAGVTAHVVIANWAIKKFSVDYEVYVGGPTGVDLPKDESNVEYNTHPAVKNADGGDFVPANPDGWTFAAYVIKNGSTETEYKTLDAIRGVAITANTTIYLKWAASTETRAVTFVYKDALATTPTQAIVPTWRSGAQSTTAADGTVTVTFNVPYNGVLVKNSDYTEKPIYNSTETVVQQNMEPTWTPGGSYTLDSKVTQDETFTLSYKGAPKTVTYNYKDKDGNDKTATETVEFGKHPAGITPTAPEGYNWTAWEDSAHKKVDLAAYTVTGDVEFTAVYSKNTVVLKFDLNGGQADPAATTNPFADQNVPVGEASTPVTSIPQKFGYTFKCWTDDAAGEGNVLPVATGVTISKATTAYAQWLPNKYQLKIVTTDIPSTAKYNKVAIPGDGIVATIPVYGGASGTSFEVKELTADGYAFDGYTYKATETSGTTPEEVTKTVAANSTLVLDKSMKFDVVTAPVVGTSAGVYNLVLTPVITSKFYTVKFVNKDPVTGESLGDVVEQTFQYAPTRATSWRLTTPKMKDGTELPVGAVYSDLYLNAWMNGSTAWDFTKNVTGDMTLTASYKPIWTVTFQLRDGQFAEGETGKRLLIAGESLESMAKLAKDNKALADYLTSKGSVNFELPKATREGYNTVSWMDGTTAFETTTTVSKNLKLTDKWTYEFMTVTYYQDDTLNTSIGSDEVVKGSTVTKRDDPVDPAKAFACWKYTDKTSTTTEDPEFVFGSTKVTKNINVYATWTTDPEASDGTRNYATLTKAAEGADAGATIKLLKDVAPTATVTVAKNLTFDFSSNKVTGGKFTVSNSATLTIKSGTFDGVAFEGAGTVDLKDGTFLGKQFGDATATLTTFGGKYDAAAARAINGKQLLEGDKVLAVTTTAPDSYYRCVEKQTVAFVTVEGTQSIANIFIGKGESPKHAIDEAHEAKVINDAVFKTIKEGPEAEGKKFTKWTLGKGESAPEFKYTDTTAYTGGDAVAIANYETTHKVTFKVYGDDGIFVNVVDGEKVAAIPGDVQIAIDAHNAKQGPKAQDVLEGWVGSDGKTVVPTTVKITADTVFTAKMKAKLVFVKADGEFDTLVQAPHDVRYSSLPAGTIPAGTWISADGVILDMNDFVKGDVTFYEKTGTNTSWNLISFSPEVGATYNPSNRSVVYRSDDFNTPIVAEMSGSNVVLSFTIEAPSAVKESDGYRISFNGGVPVTINAQGGSEPCWAGLSPNKNLMVTVTETLTIDEIKTAAKAGTTFEYSYEFYPKTGAAVTNSKFTVSFTPRNLLLTNYTLNPDNPSKTLLIKDVSNKGVYEYTLKYDLAGGKFTDDTKATSTVEWGTKVVLPANPSLTNSLFDKWTVTVPTATPAVTYSGGYTDLEGNVHKEGYDIGGKLYGGAFVNKVFVPNNFIMTENVSMKASYTGAVASVVAYDNNKDTSLGSFALTTLVSDVAKALPKPSQEGESKIFDDWYILAYYRTTPTGVNNWKYIGYLGRVKTGAKIADFFTEAELGAGISFGLEFDASYVQAYKMTYKNGNDTLLVVKNKSNVTDASSYYTDEAKALEPTIKLFQYWTKTAPGTDGFYDKAPDKYNFSTERVTEQGVTLYAYALKNYEVTYDANGGKDAPAQQTKIHDVDLKLATTVPTLIGRDFLGWAKTATATEPEFKAGDLYKDNKDVTLYAVWSTADQVTEFVKRAYSLILGRDADQSGLDYWVKGLKDKTFKGGDIVSQFMNSDEYVLANHPNAEAVTAVYKTMLDREPDAEGQAYWVGLLDEGASYNLIINGFCDSAEFKGICEQYGIEPGTVATERRDENLKVTGFVSRNYKCALNRSGDSFGLNYWAGQLLDKAQTPYQVAHGFVFSEECVGRNLNNTQFVTMLYKLYMDRDPEADGLAYWVGQLDNKTMTREEVEKGFADSPEFAEIIKSYGL